MGLDHSAIYKAYEGIVASIDDVKGAFDKDGKSVSLDQSKIDAARTAIDKELTNTKYQRDRTETIGTGRNDAYASIEDQLDMQYHDAVNGTTTWKDHIAAVKAKYPKPS